MRKEHKIPAVISILLFLLSCFFICIAVSFICITFDLPRPYGYNMLIVIFIPSFLLHGLIIHLLEKRKNKDLQAKPKKDSVNQGNITNNISNCTSLTNNYANLPKLSIIGARPTKLKKQVEVIDSVIKLLNSEDNPWSKDVTSLGAYLIIAPLLKQIIKRDRVAIIEGLKQEGLNESGKELAILASLINKTTWDLLASGQYHLSRGILTEQGESLKQLFFTTMNYLHENGYIDDAIVKNWSDILHEEIQNVE